VHRRVRPEKAALSLVKKEERAYATAIKRKKKRGGDPLSQQKNLGSIL